MTSYKLMRKYFSYSSLVAGDIKNIDFKLESADIVIITRHVLDRHGSALDNEDIEVIRLDRQNSQNLSIELIFIDKNKKYACSFETSFLYDYKLNIFL